MDNTGKKSITAECEETSSSNSEAIVLNGNIVKLLTTQREVFTSSRVLQVSKSLVQDGAGEGLTDWHLVCSNGDMVTLCQKQSSPFTALSDVFQPSSSGLLVWIMTKRARSQVQAAEMSFLCRVAELSLNNKVRSFIV